MPCLKALFIAAISLIVFATFTQPARSQSQPQSGAPLRVVTRVIEPLVVRQGDALSGFSIDFWQEVANRTGVRYEFVVLDRVTAMLDAGDADAAIAAISMTPERELRYDFSHMYLQSGLQIMTPS